MSGEEGEIEVYFSHKRVSDGMSEFAQALYDAGNAQHGFTMNADCTDAEHSKFIDEFVDGLISSPYVVFLLNDDYFYSPWCMHEFLEYIKRHELGVSGYFIACDGWLDSEKNPIFSLDGYNSFLSFWEQKKAHADVRVKRVAERVVSDSIFSEGFDSLGWLRQFFFNDEKKLWDWCNKEDSLLQSSPEDRDLSKAQVIWDRFLQIKDRKQEELKPRCYDELLELTKKSFQLALDTPLEDSALRRSLNVSLDSDRYNSVSDYFWSISPSDAFIHLFSRTEAVLKSSSRDRTPIKDEAVNFLGMLLIRMLHSGFRDSIFPQDRSPLDRTAIQIQETLGFAPDLLMGALSPTNTGARLQNKDGSIIADRNSRIDQDLKGKPFTSTAKDDVDRWGMIIWTWVTRKKFDPNKTSLNAEDWGRLSDLLKGEFNRGHGRYIVLNSSSNPKTLKNDGIAKTLKWNLPYLFIIETGIDGENTPRLLDTSYGDIEMNVINVFNNLFSDYPD